MHAGKQLKKLQLKHKITSTELASHLGVRDPQVNKWRNSEDMKLSTVLLICEYAGVTINEFLEN